MSKGSRTIVPVVMSGCFTILILGFALFVGQKWTVLPMINIIGAFVTLIGAFAFGWIGNLPMTIAMLAGVIYFKEYK